ncbi:class Ib ribonucleoside-diphosphate reductase assembly flavoprotein NrdI [Bacillus safensis]|uniref:class Ib ribonucleoside-diphosphate reductase assembly flavoprotein NrdI n=1 Tax=Bacillus safensis TaxID=561879 RepID=UPI00227F07BC|nr:class Ib ribonucleoside-diphosphate reductase assembly flavoprotein NrdI [Bacillus safensis]MCY7542413.1 class Ib ribonucleoside-diphosphate reductase assembly flavoprotein NrdI [Bacillus safensis]MCY7552254.1 class Ib ribonucleoside-diphosphate reductase assembly flavoprotein NrdI [Bacillus safensis]MCY7644719.1 class Ib ribonucleoside-diphosphate reductase assembly flavoprotein NrdI [Bacillus safensis]MCY7655966.1 class Ib ribonucleoside-diphosphate reductase assembly flavoprotein NrdI [Ba
MLITYDTLTGNVQRFINKITNNNYSNVKKITEDTMITEPFIHITYTIGFGEVPKLTQIFIHNNKELLRGICSSGNKNWGNNFGLAADKIANQYNVPILLKFELAGTDSDVATFLQEVKFIDNQHKQHTDVYSIE